MSTKMKILLKINMSNIHVDRLNIYLAASFHFSPLIPNVLPQLKPSHPHHNINVPSKTFVGEAI